MRLTFWLTALTLSLATGSAGSGQEAPALNQVIVKYAEGQGGGETPAPGKPWIGVRLAPTNELLAEHLGLEPGQGLLIEEVLADSPAAEAQLKRHDLLLSAGGTLITSVEDLSNVLGEVGGVGGAVAIELIRAGKRQSVSITPKPAPGASNAQVTWRAVSGLHLAATPPLATPLPEDIEVTIVKKGKEPAKITVRRGAGHDQWHMLPDDSLERLPEDLREPIAALIGRSSGAGNQLLSTIRVNGLDGDRLAVPQLNWVTVPRVATIRPAGESTPASGDRLDEIVRRLEAIEKALGERAEK